MNQGRGIYLDLCGHSIRLVTGLINLQFQVRTKMAACWKKSAERLLGQARLLLLYLHYAGANESLIRVMLRDDIYKYP